MTVNVAHHIGAVIRETGTREKDGRQVRYLIAIRTYDTDAADLWDALTNKERIPRWFLPVSGDLKLGGSYAFEGNASGTITACEPPRRLALTWGMHGDVSWVEIRLHEEKDRTRLELEHVAFVPDEMWKQYGPGAVGVGWDGALLGLALHLASDASVNPESASTWAVSENGKEFSARSSDSWADAWIASGADPTAAREAAARTTAFYTGG